MFGSPGAWAAVLEVSLDGLDQRTLKRAYARKLKTIDPVENPEDFQALREAFEGLKRFAPKTPKTSPVSEPEPPAPNPAQDAPGIEDVQARETTPPVDITDTDDVDPVPVEQPEESASTPADAPEPPTRDEAPAPKPLPLRPRPASVDQAPLRSQAEEAERLVAQVKVLIKSPWASGKWDSVLGDPAMRDLATADQVERALYAQIMTHMYLNQDEEDELPPTLDGDALDLIEKRFAWFSDVTRLQKKFGAGSQRLVTALVTEPNRPVTQPMTTGYRDKWSNIPRLTRAQRVDRVLNAPWFFSSLIASIFIWALIDSILPYVAP